VWTINGKKLTVPGRDGIMKRHACFALLVILKYTWLFLQNKVKFTRKLSLPTRFTGFRRRHSNPSKIKQLQMQSPRGFPQQ
jgi:hypothetical protein